MPDVVIPAATVLGHVEAVELIQTGTWPASTGPFEATAKKLAAAVEALDCTAVRRPVLKLGHDDTNGEPAVGWVDNLRTANEGQTLVGDFRGMPAWLTELDADGVSILAAAYPDRSVEGEHDYVCAKGHVHPFVVTAVALLGVEKPAVGTLESLIDLYGVAASAAPHEHGGVVLLTTPGGHMPKKVAAAATTDDVRRAFYDGPGQNWNLWIREMYIDPAELIVNNDEDGTISRVTYAIAADGAVEFGEFEQVKVQYVAARASAGDRAAAWASKGDARAGMPHPQTPAGVPPAGATPTGEEPAVAFSDEQLTNLRKLAGVADDADESVIMAALDEAIGEASIPTPPPPQPPPTPAPEPNPQPTPQSVAAAGGRIPEGAVVLDRETLERLQEQGRKGEAAAAHLAADVRDRTIHAAIYDDHKFAPSRAEHWRKSWDADPEGTKQLIASMPKDMIPTSMLGTAGDPDDFAEGEFDHLFSRAAGGGPRG